MKCYFCLFLLIIRIDLIIAWENYELDLFDLVEELGLNTNFYDLMGVEQTAELSDIKKAYRKLSLLWHPDKSDEPNAEQKFRQLVAVYEILKDEQRRARYDRILVEGLPKWNQPIYYYRRAKKLRIWELFTILSLIFTIGHYLVLWAIYFESTLTMSERWMDERKRLEKKMKKAKKVKEVDQTMIDEEMARTMETVVSPQLTDILPIRLAFFIVDRQFFLSDLKSLFYAIINRRRQSPTDDIGSLSEDENENDRQRMKKKTPVIRIQDIVPEMATNRHAPVVNYLATSPTDENEQLESQTDDRPWSDEEKQLLCKIIVRFPPGTSRRWEKIASALNRPLSQVIDIAKEIQNTVGSSTNCNFAGQDISSQTSLSSKVMLDQNLITEREPSEPISDWSQNDQRLLEYALKAIPKDTPGVDRWEEIARCVPGKTRDECLARYRYIAQLLKTKKSSKSGHETKKRE